MLNPEFENALSGFIAHPAVVSATSVLANSRTFLIQRACSWQNSGLTLKERMRELLAELFLILIEEVNIDLVNNAFSLVSYLDLKLRRLTRPKRRRVTAYTGIDDLKDSGRYNFDAFKIELTREIVLTLRRVLAEQKIASTGMLEFLFIHVYPEIAWASRLLAQKYNEDISRRQAADRHRHLKFNRRLRHEFSLLASGDYSEIKTWSSGERSHLAWRIIDLSVKDTSVSLLPELSKLARWRESFDKQQNVKMLDNCEKLFSALKDNISTTSSVKSVMVNEEAAFYGPEPDVLAELIGLDSGMVSEPEADYKTEVSYQNIDQKIIDNDFDQVCSEIETWLKHLLNKQKNGDTKWV